MDAEAALNDAFQMEKGTLGSAIRTAREAKGFTREQIAARFKVTVQAVGQWERDETVPSAGKLFTLCKMLEIDPGAAAAGELKARPDMSQAEPEAAPPMEIGSLQTGPLDVEVRGITVGGDDAEFFFNGTVVNRVARPPGLRYAANVFALEITGDSMSPRFEAGDLIYCQLVPPRAGDDVVVELYGDEASPAGKSFVKRYVKRASGILHCRQFNPPVALEFDVADIKAVYRIIPLRELMGG